MCVVYASSCHKRDFTYDEPSMNLFRSSFTFLPITRHYSLEPRVSNAERGLDGETGGRPADLLDRAADSFRRKHNEEHQP